MNARNACTSPHLKVCQLALKGNDAMSARRCLHARRWRKLVYSAMHLITSCAIHRLYNMTPG